MILIPPELQHEEVEIMRRLRNGERIEHFETQRLTKDGQRVNVSLTISPIRDATGKLVGASKIARDISDRLRAVDTSLRLAAIVESSEDAIVGKDLNGIITSWNAAATRIFGYEPEEIIGQSVLRLIPRHLHSEEPMILSRLRAGERVEHFESRRVRKDGRLIDVSLTISPIKDPSGKVIGASKIARDITEKKRIERALVETEKLAVTGQMAATLAHEVNNPLEAIMNLAFLLERDTSLSAPGRAYAETLLEQVRRASEITRQTLSFYRGTSVAAEVYVPALFAGILSSKKAKIKAKNVIVRVECDGNSRTWGVAGELNQLFVNLVENAIDAVGLEGQIRIRTRDLNARAVCISISDNGGGMSPETVQRAFEPFFTTKREKGTGLGLWVSQGIVRNHGGKIRIRTRQVTQWHGTTISVLLPTEEARGVLNRPQRIAV
jgi:PAS domain S-box-containing protein